MFLTKDRNQFLIAFIITILFALLILFFAGQASANGAEVEDVSAAGVTEVSFPGRSGERGERDLTALADALGVSVEELEAAMDAVQTEAVETAVEAGIITEEEGDAVLEGESRLPRGASEETGFDKDEALAEELEVTVEEVETARDEVRETGSEEREDRGDRGRRGNGRGGNRPAQPDNGDGDGDGYPAP